MNLPIHELDLIAKNIEPQEVLKLYLVMRAWEKLGNYAIEDDKNTFYYFYSKPITVHHLSYIFEKLAALDIKLFTLFHFDYKKLDDKSLSIIARCIYNSSDIPRVNDLFFNNKNRRGQMYVPNQIAELGLKLLQNKSEEIYVPFSDTFAYAEFTNTNVFADSTNANSLLIVELINILEDKEITLNVTNSLLEPAFLDQEAPHKLKMFDSVLSFPAFGVQEKIDLSKDRYHRYKFHQGLDIAQVEHILSQTNHKAVVLTSVGFTYRGGANEKFRKYLVENNLIEAVVQLPPNIFSTTSIETTFIIFNKQKKDARIFFLNLKDESFIKRDGRQLVFKSIDEIVSLYCLNEDIENISSHVDIERVSEQNYSLAIDKYVDSKNAKSVEKELSQVACVELETFATIIRSQIIQNEESGRQIFEISPADFIKGNFTTQGSKAKQIVFQDNKLNAYRLMPYDVLVSTKGSVGKVGIVGEIYKDTVPSQAIQVIRVKECENKKVIAIALYMYLKSDLGQRLLSTLVTGVAMPQIMASEIKKLKVPLFIKEMTDEYKKIIIGRFEEEMDYYEHIKQYEQKIAKLNSDFLKLGK